MTTHTNETAQKCERLIYINWPALWCLIFFVVGLLVGRSM